MPMLSQRTRLPSEADRFSPGVTSIFILIRMMELIRACEQLLGQGTVLTVKENEAVARCTRDLENKILPDPQQSDRPIPYPTSHR